MNCSRCGTAVPAGSNFCPRCGAPLAVSGSEPAPFPPPMPLAPVVVVHRKRKVDSLAMAMLGVALVVMMILGLAATGVVKVGAAESGPVVLVPRGAKGTPVLQQPAAKAQMPKQIRDYLEHVQRIEERKNRLSAKQISQAATFLIQKGLLAQAIDAAAESGLDEPQEEIRPDASGTLKSLVSEWQELIGDFEAVPAPFECRPLADDYFQAVSEIPGWTADIEAILAEARKLKAQPAGDGPLEQLIALQGTSQKSIDDRFADADDKLAELCEQFETRKWFDIRTDVGGGLTSRLGF